MNTLTKVSRLRVAKSTKRYTSCFCPFHNDQHASAIVYHDSMWFVCFTCHISLPLDAVVEDVDQFERGLPDDLDLIIKPLRYHSLSDVAKDYLATRGIYGNIPNWVKSPENGLGIALMFTTFTGDIVGAQIRLFPENVENRSWRYMFEGKRLQWLGNYRPHKNLFVFEKAFAAVKAQIAIDMFGLDAVAISSVGSHFQTSLLDMTTVDTVFFFDNDDAGRRAGKRVKEQTGATVVVPKHEMDELSFGEMKEKLERYMR